MPGITNPAEEYFKDGQWGWDAVAGAWVKLLVDADGRLIVAAEDKVYAHFASNAGQDIPNADWTIVDYEDQIYDPDDLVTTGAAWKFTAGTEGYYHVTAAVVFAGTADWTAVKSARLSIYVNGVAGEQIDYKANRDNTATQYVQVSGSTDVHLGVGDFVDIRVYQNTGAALALVANALYNYVAIHRI